MRQIGYLTNHLTAHVERLRAIAARLAEHGSAHDRHWRAHPAVATDEQLTFGERSADRMKAVFATWAALFGMLAFIFGWIGVVQLFGAPIDNPQLTILNLILSSLAGLQCFVLLIAAKRADQIAAAIALHTYQNTESLKVLIEQNTALTEQVADLTRAVHDHLTQQQQGADR